MKKKINHILPMQYLYLFWDLCEPDITKQALAVYVGCWFCVTADIYSGIVALEKLKVIRCSLVSIYDGQGTVTLEELTILKPNTHTHTAHAHTHTCGDS